MALPKKPRLLDLGIEPGCKQVYSLIKRRGLFSFFLKSDRAVPLSLTFMSLRFSISGASHMSEMLL